MKYFTVALTNVHVLVIGTDRGKKVDPFGDTKRMILNLLLDGSKTAGEIADKLKIQKSAISSRRSKQLDHILRWNALADQQKHMR